MQLTKFTGDDFPLYASLVFNEAVMGMNLGRVFTREEAELFFGAILAMNESGGIAGYYQVLHSGEFIGMFGICENEDGDVEIEYMLLPEYWGRGYATSLVKEQISRITAACPGRKILAITDPRNTRSIRVLEQNNFGKVRDFVNGDGEDASLYTWHPWEFP